MAVLFGGMPTLVSAQSPLTVASPDGKTQVWNPAACNTRSIACPKLRSSSTRTILRDLGTMV